MTAGDTSQSTPRKFLRCGRSCFNSIRFSLPMAEEGRRSTFGPCSRETGVPCTKQSYHKDYQPLENNRRSQQPGLVQRNHQNSGVPKKKPKNEFEKFPNSATFVIWKMNLKSGVCSSSSFPTEAMVRINEVDSARSMYEFKSSSSPFSDEYFQTSRWSEGWGPEGLPRTGGGGPARVPNLRPCKHPVWGWHRRKCE